MAVGALSAARKAGIEIPEDMSLCGFDDVQLAADLSPGLTTMHVPLREMGRVAVACGLAPESPEGKRDHVYEAVLIQRDSVARHSWVREGRKLVSAADQR
jgi:LacI family transcriptional regulator